MGSDVTHAQVSWELLGRFADSACPSLEVGLAFWADAPRYGYSHGSCVFIHADHSLSAGGS
jgi:hypothetical protein